MYTINPYRQICKKRVRDSISQMVKTLNSNSFKINRLIILVMNKIIEWQQKKKSRKCKNSRVLSLF